MKLSDCPFAVGTPEHSAWVRTVYIPFREALVVNCSTPQPGSAASVGRKLIDGRAQDHLITKTLMAKLMGRPEPDEKPTFANLDRGTFDIGIVPDPEAMRTNQVTFFVEEFETFKFDKIRFCDVQVP